jgi:serine/threonine-protein kinase
MNTQHAANGGESNPPMSTLADHTLHTMLDAGMMEAPARPGSAGTVDRFEVVRTLGVGGMGLVLLAREPATGATVAIKMVRPDLVTDQAVVRAFLREAQHMVRMAHPNILKVVEVSDRKAGPYYVMPYIETGSLADRIRPGHALAAEETLAIARQIAEALAYAHSRGIIHRDLKPANVLIDAQGRAYLTDFGLLRTVFNDSMLDVTKTSAEGTAPYMSPGIARGRAEDTRCDIYAFGAMLYEMLTGDPPYQAPTVQAILDSIAARPPRPVREVNPAAPAALVAIAENAMARELRDRYAEMSDVVRDLARVAAAQAPLGPHGRAAARVGRWIGLAAAVLVVLGATVLVAGVLAAFGIRHVRKQQWLEARAEESRPAQTAQAGRLDAERLAARGWQLWGQRQLAEAEQVFTQAVAADPDCADAWNGLGWARQNQGMPLNAKEAFEHCVALDPKHAGALNGLGVIARMQGRTDEAIACWERAVQALPQATAALSGLAATYMELAQYEKAIKYYRMWQDAEPDNRDVARLLAEAEKKRAETR